MGSVDVAINGHTHVTKEAQVGRCLVLNPGSASYPRGTRGPTMARMLVKDGKILSTKFIDPVSYTHLCHRLPLQVWHDCAVGIMDCIE